VPLESPLEVNSLRGSIASGADRWEPRQYRQSVRSSLRSASPRGNRRDESASGSDEGDDEDSLPAPPSYQPNLKGLPPRPNVRERLRAQVSTVNQQDHHMRPRGSRTSSTPPAAAAPVAPLLVPYPVPMMAPMMSGYPTGSWAAAPTQLSFAPNYVQSTPATPLGYGAHPQSTPVRGLGTPLGSERVSSAYPVAASNDAGLWSGHSSVVRPPYTPPTLGAQPPWPDAALLGGGGAAYGGAPPLPAHPYFVQQPPQSGGYAPMYYSPPHAMAPAAAPLGQQYPYTASSVDGFGSAALQTPSGGELNASRTSAFRSSNHIPWAGHSPTRGGGDAKDLSPRRFIHRHYTSEGSANGDAFAVRQGDALRHDPSEHAAYDDDSDADAYGHRRSARAGFDDDRLTPLKALRGTDGRVADSLRSSRANDDRRDTLEGSGRTDSEADFQVHRPVNW
jgi:hypothetical protein